MDEVLGRGQSGHSLRRGGNSLRRNGPGQGVATDGVGMAGIVPAEQLKKAVGGDGVGNSLLQFDIWALKQIVKGVLQAGKGSCWHRVLLVGMRHCRIAWSNTGMGSCWHVILLARGTAGWQGVLLAGVRYF